MTMSMILACVVGIRGAVLSSVRSPTDVRDQRLEQFVARPSLEPIGPWSIPAVI